MTWFKWLLVVLIVISTAANVAMVGKEREPLSPGAAAAVVLVNVFLVIGLILNW